MRYVQDYERVCIWACVIFYYSVSRYNNVFAKYFTPMVLSGNTHGDKMIHTLLVKYFNDLLDGQKSERSIDKVTYFYVGDLFCIHLGTKYANFQEKIFADISGRKLQTLYSSNVENWHTLCEGVYKKAPQHRSM